MRTAFEAMVKETIAQLRWTIMALLVLPSEMPPKIRSIPMVGNLIMTQFALGHFAAFLVSLPFIRKRVLDR